MDNHLQLHEEYRAALHKLIAKIEENADLQISLQLLQLEQKSREREISSLRRENESLQRRLAFYESAGAADRPGHCPTEPVASAPDAAGSGAGSEE